MSGIIYEEQSILQFFFITVLLGGWAAWMTGRSCAITWRSPILLGVYLLLLGIAVRFIHHALFDGTMFSLHYYAVDTIILMFLGMISFRYTRTRQMVENYSWLYERTGPLTWRSKSAVAHGA